MDVMKAMKEIRATIRMNVIKATKVMKVIKGKVIKTIKMIKEKGKRRT